MSSAFGPFWKAIDATELSIASSDDDEATRTRRWVIEHSKICARDAAEHFYLSATELRAEDFEEATLKAKRTVINSLIRGLAETDFFDMALATEVIDTISKSFDGRLVEIDRGTTRPSKFMEMAAERCADALPGPETRAAFLDCLAVLARSHIEAAHRRAMVAPSPTLASAYAAFNRTAAYLIDALRRTAAEDNFDDPEFVEKAEQTIIQSCHRRAAELTASLNQGGNL